MPLTFLHPPGLSPGILPPREMLRFLDQEQDRLQKELSLTLLWDLGFLPLETLRQLDRSGIGYILRLHTASDPGRQLTDRAAERLWIPESELTAADGGRVCGMTLPPVCGSGATG